MGFHASEEIVTGRGLGVNPVTIRHEGDGLSSGECKTGHPAMQNAPFLSVFYF
jgi:hypothetical protein